MSIIDLRSDTVTKPSPGMRKAIAEAEVGDDVFGEDPTVNKLQQTVAEMLGKEKALFVPSGVMGNQLAIKSHTQPGDEIIVEQNSHIFHYETVAPAIISGVQIYTIPGCRGVITAEQIKPVIRSKAYYMPNTRLIALENTHNRAGGTIFPIEEIRRVRDSLWKTISRCTLMGRDCGMRVSRPASVRTNMHGTLIPFQCAYRRAWERQSDRYYVETRASLSGRIATEKYLAEE